MWSLVPLSEEEGGQRLRLLVGKKYTLGRQNADFVIANDKSISRLHATLFVTHPDANVSHPHKPPVLTVKDTSKFGTVVRDEKIVDAQQLIKNGDTVKFGTVNSIFSAVYEPYVVTTSCLDPAAKKQTKLLTTRLGGHVVSDWRRECQLLVMSNLSVTVKVICALVSLKPIVTVQYLEKLTEAIDTKQPQPSPDEFTPPLTESQLNPNEVSFKKDERRRTLFLGKVFIFLSPKQFKKLNVAVELAGGTPMLMEEGTDDNEDDILVQPNTCVMECKPDDVTNQFSQNAQDWMRHVFSVLKKHGRREIPDCELGFAVLYCSTERYCNPKMEAAPSQSANVASQSLSQQVAPPSQSQQPGPSTERSQASVRVKQEPMSQSRVPSTPPRSNPITKYMTKKRPRDDDDDDEEPEAARNKVKVPRIKEELGGASTSASRSTRARRSISPKPDSSTAASLIPKAETSRSRSPSPAPRRRGRVEAAEPSPPPTPRRSPRSPRSPSPAPENSPPRRGRKAQSSKRSPSPVSPKPEPSDDFDDFDTFKPRSRRKRSPSPAPASSSRPKAGSAREQSSSPARRSQRQKVSSRSPSPAPKPEVEDDFDDFDAFQPRSRRKPTQSQSQAPVSSSKEKVGTSCSVVSSTTSPASSKSSVTTLKQERKTPLRKKPQVEEDDLGEPVREPRRHAQEFVPRVRRPLVDEEDDSEEEESRPRRPQASRAGFLSAVKPIKDQMEPTEDYQEDPSVPKDAGVVVTCVRLTVPRRQRQAAVTENNNTINGKVVKNFKRFKKVFPAGAEGLPRIIGGSDLRPHVNSARQVDEWFAEERQVEEERKAEERIADDMFAWKPTKVKKTPAARKR